MDFQGQLETLYMDFFRAVAVPFLPYAFLKYAKGGVSGIGFIEQLGIAANYVLKALSCIRNDGNGS
ncbi:hypothetical protein F7984_10705 [Pradoshia sp. D12]|uniref:hypothetical protein n=1 Tax=Bacillaceae TaxID=186817 RepID=UPI001125E240|nr:MULTISPECIES: hypothetical protein [Bacillaceae]QFK71664.1 hypothetical protein F7984_10705 [Pradoshia sp. D12]TPF73459.1 hypothetical protein FHY44_07100 [Bacillus sp. D12]